MGKSALVSTIVVGPGTCPMPKNKLAGQSESINRRITLACAVHSLVRNSN